MMRPCKQPEIQQRGYDLRLRDTRGKRRIIAKSMAEGGENMIKLQVNLFLNWLSLNHVTIV